MPSIHTFTGKWITSERFAHIEPRNVFHRQLAPSPGEEEAELKNRHILFRRKFTLTAAEAANARIFISADDYYKLYLNGRFVGQGPTPAYDFHYYYNEMDLSGFLHEGENTLALHTYYQGLINRVWVSGDHQHGAILDIVADGKTLLSSDTSFLQHEHSAYTACGIAGYDTQFMERYDAAAPEVGFQQPGFDDSCWRPALLREHEHYQLAPQPSRQLVFEEIRPAAVMRRGNRIFIDFGAIYVGYLSFSAHGGKGDRLALRFGQELLEDGSVRFDMRCNCKYEEFMLLSGKPHDAFSQFDYMSFRYAEIMLPDGTDIDEDSLLLVARHYPFQLATACRYQDQKTLQVWNLCVDSLRYGFQEVNQDCMEREKGYYLGDGCFTLLTYCVLIDDFTLLEKFFDDFLSTRFINRGLVTCGTCSLMQEIAESPLMMFPLLHAYASLTRNLDYVRARLDAFRDILDYYREQYTDRDGLINRCDKWCVVEWPKNYQDGYDVVIQEGEETLSKHVVLNACYLGAIKYCNSISEMLGQTQYTPMEPLLDAFSGTFWDSEHKQFKDSDVSSHISFVGNAYPYYFGLFPEKAGKDEFLRRLRRFRMGKLGIDTTFPVLGGLARDGEFELIHELVQDEGAWLNMIGEGATRTFEMWSKDYKWNTSLFHLILASGVLFIADYPIQGILLKDSF